MLRLTSPDDQDAFQQNIAKTASEAAALQGHNLIVEHCSDDVHGQFITIKAIKRKWWKPWRKPVPFILLKLWFDKHGQLQYSVGGNLKIRRAIADMVRTAAITP